MLRIAARVSIVAGALSLLGFSFATPARAYTLMDWMRTWPRYQPMAAVPVAGPMSAPLSAPPVASTAPALPPAPSVATTQPPLIMQPPPAYAAPALPPSYPTPAPVPSCAAPAYTSPAFAAPSCAAPAYAAPVYGTPSVAGPSCAAPAYAGPTCSAPAYAGPTCSAPGYGSPTYAGPSCAAPPAAVATQPVRGTAPAQVCPPTSSCDVRTSACDARLPAGAMAPSSSRWCCLGWFGGGPRLAYRPQVRYRTTWNRVPTTNYRPVTVYDPVTGYPGSQLQPCTTYTWQVQRVPYTTYLPSFAFTAPAPAASYAAPTTAPNWSGYAASSYANIPAASLAPPPVPADPGSRVPLAPPPVPSAAPSPASAGPALGDGSTPADRAPSLLNGEGTTSQRLPVPELSPLPQGTNSEAAAEKTRDPADADKGPAIRVIPLPDPEAGSTSQPPSGFPSLFDPSERTAQAVFREVSWAAAPIEWARPLGTRPRQPTVLPSPDSTAPSPESHPAPESAGWRSVRN